MTSLSYNGYKGLRQNYYIPVITGTKFDDCVMSENFLKRKFPDCQNKSDDINCFVKINGFNSLIERFLKYFHMENDVKEIIKAGDISDALCYEIKNMENAVENGKNTMRLGFTIDVMNIMTTLRNQWNMKYPEEL